MSPRDWDAGSYERVSAPLEAMGREVLDRLDLDGDERVLDAGCGTGRVTAALVERLPRGEVVAVDGSPAMVEAARERLGETVELRVADLVHLTLDRPVDAILSTATFHWIADHDALFASLREVLRPGGRLVAQCGGAGNIAALKAAAELVGEREPQHVRVEPDDPHQYIGTVALGSHLDRLDSDLRGPYIEAVLAELDEPVVEYVRLNILARRPS
jgi:trans-aconitate 2-methyltransferase